MQLNRHTQEVHVRQNQDKGEDKVESQQIGATTISQVYACNMCQYKTVSLFLQWKIKVKYFLI